MKYRILLIVFCLFFSADLIAQQKVTERSTRKQPQWVGGVQSDYIIVSAIADELETAKEKAMDQVRRQIISSVAEHVKAGTESRVTQQTSDREIVRFLDTFTSSMATQSANIPYLQGITTAKAEDFYWEKRLDKKTQEVSYLYAIKYPFSSLERKKLAYEFNKRDQEMTDRLAALEKGFGEITQVNDINNAISGLEPLIAYFFDDVRKGEAIRLQRDYRKLYDDISFRAVSSEPGKYVFALMLNGREISVTRPPQLKSECATRLAAQIDGTRITITYDYGNCDRREENPVSLTFRFGSRYVTHTFYVDPQDDAVDIRPEGTMTLRAVRKEASSIGDIAVRMDLNSLYSGTFTLRTLILTVPGLESEIMIDGIDKTFRKGRSIVNLTAEGDYEVLEKQDNRQNMLRGMLYVTLENGEQRRIDFALPFRPNW